MRSHVAAATCDGLVRLKASYSGATSINAHTGIDTDTQTHRHTHTCGPMQVYILETDVFGRDYAS